MRLVLFIVVLFNLGICLGQTKVEYEKRVDASEIPSEAKEDLFDCFEDDVKVKWFYQRDGKKKVYEAKFDYKGIVYSVEFELDGEIENVEVLLNEKDMESSVLESIKRSVSKAYSDFKILKIQREYVGDDDDLFAVIKGEFPEDVEINYEVEVNVKQNKRRKLYEVILAEDYEILSRRRIKLQSTDVLDY